MASIISASTTSGTALNMSADTTGVLQLATGATPTTAVTIDASQNVGIGTTSPVGTAGVKLDVRGSITGGAAGNGRASLEQGTSTNSGYLSVWNTDISTRLGYVGYATLAGSGTFNVMSENSTNALVFGTNATERMRIDSSGIVLIGTSVTGYVNANACYYSPPSGFWINSHATGTASGSAYIGFGYGAATQIGNITQNGTTAVAYNTSSDYRLKENIAPMIGALDTISKIKPVTYNWKVDGSEGQGFIAHELAEFVPDCVHGEKDAVNEDGTIKPQGIDTSFLVATLTAAIQELAKASSEQQTLIVSHSELINSLTARVTALEAK
jgi:hypothetical protein